MADLGDLYWTFSIEDDNLKNQLKVIQDSLYKTDNQLLKLSDSFEKGFETSAFSKAGASSEQLSNQLKVLENVWNKLSFEEKFDSEGKLTANAEQIMNAYRSIISVAQEKGRTIQKILSDEIKAQEKANTAAEKAQKIAEKQRIKSEAKDMTLAAAAQEKANAAAEKQRLKRVEILRVLRQEETSIEAIRQKLAVLNSVQDKSKFDTRQFENARKEIERLNTIVAQYNGTVPRATAANRSFADSAKSVASESKRQSLVVTELLTTLRNFAGFYFARDAVKQLAEVTGQFELQLVSLKAITQNADEAGKIFSKFQTLAVKSPFQFSEIVAGAKQLAAFQVPLKDLYQTTKVITDLSAGLGVDMGRIILAYGQVQAAAVLRGTELRQFTEAGIPLVQLLADKFSLLEGRVVSAGEVFDKIGTRMVPFEMVKDIFTDLTSEGGMFYNMQEKQADTLYGKISNLKDAYQIMLNEIGTANNELLKTGVEIPMKLMENWRQLGDVVLSLVAAYGTYKAISILSYLNSQIKLFGTLGNAIANSTRLQKLLNAAMLVNPWAIIAAGVAAFSTALYLSYENSQRLNRELQNIQSEGLSNVESSVSKFDELYNKLKQAKQGSQDFRDAVKAINNQYGEYLPNLLTEQNALTELASNYDLVTQAIYNKAKAQSAEKGFAAIQEEYGKAQEDAVSRFMDNLTSSGVPKEKAKDLLKLFRTELEQQTGEYNPYDLFNKVYQGYFGTTKKYFADTEQLFNSLIQSGGVLRDVFGAEFVIPFAAEGAEALFDMSRATDGLTIATKNYNDQLDITYNKSNATTAQEREGLAVIDNQYEKIKANIKQNVQSEEEWNEAIKKLDVSKLYAISNFYKSIGRTDMANKLKADIKNLNGLQEEWQKVAVAAIGANTAANGFKPQKDESFLAYIERLKTSYKEVAGQLKLIGESQNVPSDLKNRLNQQLLALQAIASVEGVSLETEKESNKQKKSATDLLKEEADLIKKVYADYEKLRKVMGDTKAQEEIKNIYAGLMSPEKIPFDAEKYKSQLTEIAQKLQKLDVKAATDVKLDISNKSIEELQQRIKFALDKSAKEIEKHKDQFDIYKQLIEKGFTESRAQTLSFGIEFSVEEGGYDIGKFLSDQLSQTLDVVIPGVKLDFDVDTSFVDQIGDAYMNLDDSLKKQVESLENFRFEQQKNSFLKYANLVKKETPEGLGLQFDLSNVFIKYKEELTKIQAEAKAAMESVQYKKAALPTATKEEKSEKEAVDKNVKLQIEANNKIYLDKAKKLGAVYLQEKMEAAGLSEIYKNMSTASAKSIQTMLGVTRSAIDELLSGIQENLGKAGLEQFAGYFETAFNVENIEEYIEQLDLIIANLSSLTPEAAQGLGFTPEMVQQALQFATSQKSVALNTQQTNMELNSINSKRVIAAYNSIGDSTKKVIESVKGLGDAFGIEFDEVGEAAMDLAGTVVDETIDVVSTIEGTVKASSQGVEATTQAASSALQSLESASVILAIISAALKIATAIANLFASSAKKKNQNIIKDSEAQIKRLENAYADLGRAADQALGTDVYKKQADQVKNLQQQQKELQKQLITEGEKGGLKPEEAEEIRRQMVELRQQQEDVINGIRDGILGTAKDIASELGNAFFDAFAAGEDAAAAWGKKVDEIVGNILKKMLIQKLLEEPIGKAVKNYSDKFLDPKTGAFNMDALLAGADDFAKEVNVIGGNFSTALQAAIDANPELAKYLGGGTAEGEGTAEALQGLTEDTANRMIGYLNSIRAEMIIQTGHLLSLVTATNIQTGVLNQQLGILNQQLGQLQAMRTILDAVYDPARRGLRMA